MPLVKICGLKTLSDALAAIEAGADWLGFNFYPKSPRFIPPEECVRITEVVRREFPMVGLVGVFVNASAEEIRTILRQAGLHRAQLHGDEPPALLAELGGLAFKAIRLRPDQEAEAQVAPYLPQGEEALSPSASPSAFVLLDASVPGLYGGSGQVADWRAAARLAARIPLLLAGGLTPENVAEAIRIVRPWGVDVASGVESAPGVKDVEKMRTFIRHARQA